MFDDIKLHVYDMKTIDGFKHAVLCCTKLTNLKFFIIVLALL